MKRLTDYYVDPLASEKRVARRGRLVTASAIGVYLALLAWSAQIAHERQAPPRVVPLHPVHTLPDVVGPVPT